MIEEYSNRNNKRSKDCKKYNPIQVDPKRAKIYSLDIVKLLQAVRMIKLFLASLFIIGSISRLHACKSRNEGIFDGRRLRAHNTAIASTIANTINSRGRREWKQPKVEVDEIFVTPEEVM